MDINSIIREYIDAKSEKSRLEKRLDVMKKMILDAAGNVPGTLETENYTVIVSEKQQARIDTAALYSDFPDIKDVYNKVVTYPVITAAEKQQEKKTA